MVRNHMERERNRREATGYTKTACFLEPAALDSGRAARDSGRRSLAFASGLSSYVSKSYKLAIWSPYKHVYVNKGTQHKIERGRRTRCSRTSMTSLKCSAKTFRFATFDTGSISPYCCASSR